MTLSPSHFTLRIRCSGGSLLVGGYSAVPEGLDAIQAQDRHGRALIPATALRGALRETFEGLLRGAGLSACSGGDGVDPAAGGESAPCRLGEGGKPCRACRLFGTRTELLGEGRRAFSALVVGEALLEQQGEPGWTTRHNVAMDRRRRSCAEHLLTQRWLPEVSRTLGFSARGRLIGADEQTRSDLQAAIRATTHLGSGRSRGLGRVELELEWADPPEMPSRPPRGDVGLRLRLVSPAHLGLPLKNENTRSTRREIPGSVLRGTVGFALAEQVRELHDSDFQLLVHETDGALFDFLYPVEGAPPDRDAQQAATVWPLTARACKREDVVHGAVDTLLDRLAIRLAASPDQAARAQELSLRRCWCGKKGEDIPLRPPKGWRRHPGAVPTRIVTRVSLERRASSAREGALFSHEMLEAGTVFEGAIRNIPERGRSLLTGALAAPLSLGRGRAMGWGRVEVETFPLPERPTLLRRGEAFDKAMREHLARCGIPADPVGRLVPITLHSPLWPEGTEQEDDGAATLFRALGGGTLVLAARRFLLDGTWDQRTGKVQRKYLTQAGSLFVIDLGRLGWKEALPALEQLERRGAGLHRHQGFGRVVCFDPIHLLRDLQRRTDDAR